MQTTKNEKADAELTLYEFEEIVSDLLYTMFQCMDEYVTFKIKNGNLGEDISKMKIYVEKEMRKYAKGVYDVEVEDT